MARVRAEKANRLKKIFPVCHAVLGPETWGSICADCAASASPSSLVKMLAARVCERTVPPYTADLARLEWVRSRVAAAKRAAPAAVDRYEVNPTLEIIHLSWKLVQLLQNRSTVSPDPVNEDEWALVWRDPADGEIRLKAATDAELLALKIAADDAAWKQAVADRVSARVVNAALRHAAAQGLLTAPRSCLRRDTAVFPEGTNTPVGRVVADTFTLQWHITHRCDLHCRHCYDRSRRSPLTPQQALSILDDLQDFCSSRHVAGHVCFSGGNPFLYPHFFTVYRSAAQRGFSTSVLGNPVSRTKLERLMAIQRPAYFQVSLEGLVQHNDAMRGTGHFTRVMHFLELLRDAGLSSAVMLTLTKDNMDQVLLLAELLRDKTDHFTFNRLSQVGEGADLQLPAPEDYAAFLKTYVNAAADNPVIGFKDNLINIVLQQQRRPPFDGCTGYGCGAAFNFMAVLPDGETHACRKFPSPLGNLNRQSLAEIYDSVPARRYRNGPRACAGCRLRPVCGGCLAISYGCTQDIFKERDPYCFFKAAPRQTGMTCKRPKS